MGVSHGRYKKVLEIKYNFMYYKLHDQISDAIAKKKNVNIADLRQCFQFVFMLDV